MSEKRHRKLDAAIGHPGLKVTERFGDEGKVDIGIVSWGSTFGEVLEAMERAREEGIRCAAMKVVMISPLPVDEVKRFYADCNELLVCELNYEAQFANLLTAATAREVTRVKSVPGMPMSVGKIVGEIRRLSGSRRKGKRPAAA